MVSLEIMKEKLYFSQPPPNEEGDRWCEVERR